MFSTTFRRLPACGVSSPRETYACKGAARETDGTPRGLVIPEEFHDQAREAARLLRLQTVATVRESNQPRPRNAIRENVPILGRRDHVRRALNDHDRHADIAELIVNAGPFENRLDLQLDRLRIDRLGWPVEDRQHVRKVLLQPILREEQAQQPLALLLRRAGGVRQRLPDLIRRVDGIGTATVTGV